MKKPNRKRIQLGFRVSIPGPLQDGHPSNGQKLVRPVMKEHHVAVHATISQVGFHLCHGHRREGVAIVIQQGGHVGVKVGHR